MLQIEEEILNNKDRPYTEDQQKRLDAYEAKRDEISLCVQKRSYGYRIVDRLDDGDYKRMCFRRGNLI